MMKEVVEERANARHCGWPHCCKRIPIPSSDPDAANKVKIDYKTKRLLKVGESMYYCGTSCLEACTIFISSLDESSPLTRRNQLLEHAERLIEQNGNSIEGFLDALTPEKAVKEVADRTKVEESALQQPQVDTTNSNASGNSNVMDKMWTDEMTGVCKVVEDKKTYKRLRPRGRRNSTSSSSSVSSGTSTYSIKPGRVEPSEWTGTNKKFERERSDRNMDEKARLLAEKQEQELDARARREEEEEERRLLKLKVTEKSNPSDPKTMNAVEKGVASMSIENYNPLEDRPAAPPSIKDKEPERLVLTFNANEFKATRALESGPTENLFVTPSSSAVKASSKGVSSFTQLWSTLDQFYKHLKPKTGVDGDDDSLVDIAIVEEPAIDKTSTEAVNMGPLAQLLERGVKAAELAMDMATFLASLHRDSHEAYRMAINHMIAQAKMTSSPSLSSTQWRALGVLIVDRVILTLDKIFKDPNFDVRKWDERVEGQANRLKLDTSEMFLLRDYWDGLSNRGR